MKTSTCISSAPVMPAVWPQSEHIRPVKRRLPNTVDEPKNIGYYLESLRGMFIGTRRWLNATLGTLS